MTRVALPLVAVSLTNAPMQVVGVTVAGQIPPLLFGLLSGGLADRFDRRKLMLAAQVLRIVVIAGLALLAVAERLGLPALYVAAFVLGTGEIFFDTTSLTMAPAVVDRSRLVAANSRLFAIEMAMNSFVGPPLGALLVGLAIPLAFTGVAAAYGFAAVGLVLIAGDFRPSERRRASLPTEITKGVEYLVKRPVLLTLTAMASSGRFGSSALLAVLPLYAVAPGPMHLTEAEYGLLLLAMGVGSLVGTLVTGWIVAYLGRANALAAATVLFGASVAVPAITAEPSLVAMGFFLAGIASMAWNVTNVSLRQSLVTSDLMGRVHATHRFVSNVAAVAGAILAGILAEGTSLNAAFAAAATVVIAGGLGRVVITDQRIRAAESVVAGSARSASLRHASLRISPTVGEQEPPLRRHQLGDAQRNPSIQGRDGDIAPRDE
jgi:MFS family permease